MKKEKKEKLINFYQKNNQILNSVFPFSSFSFEDEKEPKLIETGSGYKIVLLMYDFPKETEFGWYSAIKNVSSQFSSKVLIQMDTNPIDKKDSMKLLGDDLKDEKSTESKNEYDNSSREEELSSKNNLYKDVKKGELSLVNTLIRITFSNPSREEIIKDYFVFIKDMKEKENILFQHQMFNNKANFLSRYQSSDYQNRNSLNRETPLVLTSNVLANSNIYHGLTFKDDTGFYLGESYGTDIFFDIFKLNPNQNRNSHSFMVVGKTGTGKSHTLKKIIKQQVAIGNKFTTFDFEKEYLALTEKLGGITIEFSRDNSINILEPYLFFEEEKDPRDEFNNQFKEHKTFIYNIFYRLNKDTFEKGELGDLTKGRLLELLDSFYESINYKFETFKSFNKFPIISDLKEYYETKFKTNSVKTETLETIDLKVSSMLLNMVSGSNSIYFNQETKIGNLDRYPIVNYNLNSLYESSDVNLKNAVVGMLIHFFQRDLNKNRDYNSSVDPKTQIRYFKKDDDCRIHSLIIDEFHLLKDDISSLKQLDVLARRVRKYKCSLGLSTQELNEFLPNQDDSNGEKIGILKSIFGQMNTLFIGQQSAMDQERVSTYFPRITNQKLTQIYSLNRGEFLLMTGNIDFFINIWISDMENDLFAKKEIE